MAGLSVNARTNISLTKDIELKKASFQTGLIQWGSDNFRRFPWRENRVPYSVLISEILLRRTTSSAVKRVYEEFLLKYPSVHALADANSGSLEKLLAKIGFQKQRTKMLIDVGKFIVGRYAGKIPNSKEELLCIPNVGDYTANAILTLAYGDPAAMVDSNVARIMKRVFAGHLKKKASYKEIQTVANMLSPEANNQEYNYALLDLGAAVCLYTIPKCKICPINGLCDYYILGSLRIRI